MSAHVSYRSVFISDVHLGTPDCRADYLLDFLDHCHCDRLYLVGDIIDLERMRRRTVWPRSHSQVIAAVQAKAAQGTEVIYIPGNHDAAMRGLAGQTLNGIQIRTEAVHATADGRRLLVRHGDELDGSTHYRASFQGLLDRGYNLLLAANRGIASLRSACGLPYWSLTMALKTILPAAQGYIRRFEAAAIASARAEGYDGYVGGHIHQGTIRAEHGVVYCNDGDWVEHCTGLIETAAGELQLIHWAEQPQLVASAPLPTAPVLDPALAASE